MPSYATIADMQKRITANDLIDLTDDERTGARNDTRITDALVQADNEIDGYVGAFYRRLDATSPVPPLLTDIACDIAHYRLFRFSTPTERVAELYKQAVAKLRDIARGILKLDQGEEQLPERDGQILVASSDRLFTRDSMGGM